MLLGERGDVWVRLRRESRDRVTSVLMAALTVATLAAGCSSEPARVPAPMPASKPYGWLDQPAGKVHGKTLVYGWALSDRGQVIQIEILLDGKPVNAQLKRVPRGGICAKYPGRADCPAPGFGGEVDFSRIAKGPHSLSARFTDSENRTVELGNRDISVE